MSWQPILYGQRWEKTLSDVQESFLCFREGYAELHVEDVQFAYNVEKLMELNKKR